MTISLEFLDKMYERKHEAEHTLYAYKKSLFDAKESLAKASTGLTKRRAADSVKDWTRCIQSADSLRCCIICSIEDYVKAHDGSKDSAT